MSRNENVFLAVTFLPAFAEHGEFVVFTENREILAQCLSMEAYRNDRISDSLYFCKV